MLFLVFNLLLSAFSYQEEIIYQDQEGNILSSYIRTAGQIHADGFEASCNILYNPTPCNQIGGGGFASVISCRNVNDSQIRIQYTNSQQETLYKHKTIYTCLGNYITHITLVDTECYALPGGGGNQSGYRQQISVTQHLCPQ